MNFQFKCKIGLSNFLAGALVFFSAPAIPLHHRFDIYLDILTLCEGNKPFQKKQGGVDPWERWIQQCPACQAQLSVVEHRGQ